MAIPGEPIATLVVDGKNYNNFKSVRVTKEYGRAYCEYQFSVAEPVDIHADYQGWQIWPGDRCQVILDGTPVINGWIEIRESAYDSNEHGVMFYGRSYEAQASDDSVRIANNGGQQLDGTFTSIVNKCLQGTGVTCVAPADDGKIIPNFGVNFGETAWEVAQRLSRYYPGMRIRADGLKSQWLAINGSSLESPSDDLVEGVNILTCRATVDITHMASQIMVLGQKANRKDESPGSAATVKGEAHDSNVTRGFKGATAEDPATQEMAQGKAGHEQGLQMQEIVHCAVKVYGWRDRRGGLYDIAPKTYTINSPMALLKRKLWPRMITFEQSDSGTFTTLELCTEESLAPGILQGLPQAGATTGDKLSGAYWGQGVAPGTWAGNATG